MDDTFSGDAASGSSASPSYGGAIFNAGTATIVSGTLANGSLTGSSTSDGAEIDNASGGTLTLYNSIAYAGAASGGNDVANAGTISGDHNLIGTQTGVPAGVILKTANPMLLPLSVNGGSIPTQPLGDGSPAIGVGNTTAQETGGATTDGRGFSRIVNGLIDLGAYEDQVYVVTNTNDAGPGSLRQMLAYDHDGEPIEFSPNTHNETITITIAPLTINTNVAIDWTNASTLTIVGKVAGSSIIDVALGVTASIIDVTISNGDAAKGGAIDNLGSLTLTDDVFTHNVAGDQGSWMGEGGAIVNQGTLTVTGTTFTDNKVEGSNGSGAPSRTSRARP